MTIIALSHKSGKPAHDRDDVKLIVTKPQNATEMS